MNVLEKVKNALNWGIDDEYEDEMYEVEGKSGQNEKYERTDRMDRYERNARGERAEKSDKNEKNVHKDKRRYSDSDNKVVSIHMPDDVRVANIRLQSFEDARKVNVHLKLDRTVLVDVSSLEKPEGQRSVDFICGIVEALDANIQKMPNSPIFVITPNGTSIVGDATDEFKYKGVFPWIK